MHCFFFFFLPTSKRSFYGQTKPASFLKIPVEKLTSFDLGEATGDDPLGEWVVKAALPLRCPWN